MMPVEIPLEYPIWLLVNQFRRPVGPTPAMCPNWAPGVSGRITQGFGPWVTFWFFFLMEGSSASVWEICSQAFHSLLVLSSLPYATRWCLSHFFSASSPSDNNTISELSSLHEDDLNFRQPYRQARRKPLPPAGDLDGDAEYWAGVIGGGSTSRSQAVSDYRDERDSFRHRWGVLCLWVYCTCQSSKLRRRDRYTGSSSPCPATLVQPSRMEGLQLERKVEMEDVLDEDRIDLIRTGLLEPPQLGSARYWHHSR